jgi:hypothetical protein
MINGEEYKVHTSINVRLSATIGPYTCFKFSRNGHTAAKSAPVARLIAFYDTCHYPLTTSESAIRSVIMRVCV